MKLKGLRNHTVKRRAEYSAGHPHVLEADALALLSAWYAEEYGQPPRFDLAPVLKTSYRRTTLVAKDGGERLTIDGAMSFAGGGREVRLDGDIFVLETKSQRGYGIADRLLRRLQLRPVGRCSKYCIGLLATGLASEANQFLPALRRLHLKPDAWSAKRPVVIASASWPPPVTETPEIDDAAIPSRGTASAHHRKRPSATS
jgi:hypothetical protein